MPIHDWTRVEAGLWHHFHHRWISALSDALNAGSLPDGYEAMIEQKTGKVEPDLLALALEDQAGRGHEPGGGTALALAPPKAKIVVQTEAQSYARRADRISIRHPLGETVAVIEFVSPGNKDGRAAVRSFVDKAAAFIDRGVHLLIVDLFPPTRRDPHGLARLIWDEFDEDHSFELPASQPLCAASFLAGLEKRAYVEPLAVGDPLPALPIFLVDERYVPAPLEESYETTWRVSPRSLKAKISGATACEPA